jgi:hypothetical protein
MAPAPDSRPSCSDAPTSALSARPPATLTSTAWSACADLTVAAWVRQGRWLGALGRGSGWWIGDWLRYGNSRYGDRYGTAARVTGYDQHSLRNMAYVAGRFEVPRRRGALSFSHHAELAALSAEEQDLWLDRAEAGSLSLRSLRSELRHARRRAASRLAPAQAGRRPDEAVTSSRPRDAAFDDRLVARQLAGTRRESHTTLELVCPACGCHFAPSADEVAHPRAASSDSEALGAQLTPASPPKRTQPRHPEIRRLNGVWPQRRHGS